MTKRTGPRPWHARASARSAISGAAAALVTLALGGGLALGADDPNVMFPDCGRTDDIEAAKIAHKAATQLFERSEYDRAIENWRDAYKLDCNAHGLLINAASAYEKKGDKESAIAMLEAYLRRAPSAPDATAIIQKIDVLRTSLPPKVDPVPTATATTTAKPIVRPPPPLPKPERPYGVKPWFVVGAGGVAVLAGAILVPAGFGLIAEAEAACGGGRMCTTGQADIASRGNTGRAEVIAGDVAIVVGIAAVAGGLVWQFALNKPRLQRPAPAPEGTGDPTRPAAPAAAPPPVSFAPFVGPGYGGVAASGSF